MSDEKILSGEQTEKQALDAIIAGNEVNGSGITEVKEITTLKERIAKITESGGLKQLPDGFDEQGGDWVVINSINPFEVLYLDYKQYKFIKPEFVKNNYEILEKFWKEKVGIMNTGGNRVAFKNKYGDGTVENSLTKLKRAFEKINTEKGIEQYYIEINNERLRKGEENLKESIEDMMVDGVADKEEILLRLKRGLQYDLAHDETAFIIKKAIDAANFKPYGTVSGNTLLEQLLSVDHWMTKQKIDEAERLKKEQESLKIQILPGKYASSIEEIGSILFNDPKEATEIIKEDLLKQVIAQKDVVLAREVGSLSKDLKNIEAAYLKIIYKLNRNLPYRFSGQMIAKSVQELCVLIFENEKSIKLGQEHLKKGYIEIWLKETNKKAYEKFITIRDTSENFEIAFYEFLYSFNKTLPYRFAGKYLIKTTSELFEHINKNIENWASAKTELFANLILVWLKNIGKLDIVDRWNKIKTNYIENKDIGLEEFLHILEDKTAYARLTVDKKTVSIPKIQSGKIVTIDLLFTNETRGFSKGVLAFSKTLPGVSLSSNLIIHNAADGIKDVNISLKIDSNYLLKGVGYETIIQLNSTTKQKIDIPVSFKIVFPTNAFILETVKYAAIGSVFFALIRLLLSAIHIDWFNNYYNFFLDWESVYNSWGKDFGAFGWIFLIFFACNSLGIFFLIIPYAA